MILFFEDEYIKLVETDGNVEEMKGRKTTKMISPTRKDGRLKLKIEYELFFNDRSGKLYWTLHLLVRDPSKERSKTLPLSPTLGGALSGPFIIEKVELEMDERLKKIKEGGDE